GAGRGRGPAGLQGAPEGRGQRGGARLDGRRGGSHVRLDDEPVDGGGAERAIALAVELPPEPALDVGAQLGEAVELAGSAREVVVERRQYLLLELLHRHVDGRAR